MATDYSSKMLIQTPETLTLVAVCVVVPVADMVVVMAVALGVETRVVAMVDMVVRPLVVMAEIVDMAVVRGAETRAVVMVDMAAVRQLDTGVTAATAAVMVVDMAVEVKCEAAVAELLADEVAEDEAVAHPTKALG